MDIFNFENLVAYQRAMDLVESVYEILKKFPRIFGSLSWLH